MLNLDQITEQGVRLDFTRPCNPKRLKRKRRKEHKEVKTE